MPHHTKVPTSSPTFHMPNVFVHPPEEDESDPWCCFDAAQTPVRDLSTVLDVEMLDQALQDMNTVAFSVPVFHRDSGGQGPDAVVMPRKRVSVSDLDAADADLARSAYDAIAHEQQGSGEDSEIVEVIKVRKHRATSNAGGSVDTARMKRSKSFKSRATSAFRSLRNVGKGSTRNKPYAQDMWASSASTQATSMSSPQLQRHSHEETAAAVPRATMSRRSSIILSQIFHPAKSQHHPDAEPTSPSSPTFPPSSSATLEDLPTADTVQALDHLHPEPDVPAEDLRAASPTPSARSTSRRRFSMLNLHRLFTFAPAPAASDEPLSPTSPSESTYTMPIYAPSIVRDSSTNSSSSVPSSSSEGPDTPMDEVYSPMAFSDPMLEKQASPPAQVDVDADTSVEMRLDSLHFDSLSFDPDNF